MVKFIFCDVDGVLNSEQFGFIGMDPACVERLQHIINQTSCAVVVSSTWRIGGIGPGSKFHEALVQAGGNNIVPHIVGTTPDAFQNGSLFVPMADSNQEQVANLSEVEKQRLFHSGRASEILQWLHTETDGPDNCRFVAIDDESLNLPDNNFVRTARGLTDADADEVIHKLLT